MSRNTPVALPLRPGALILWAYIMIHLCWGVLLFASPHACGATPLFILCRYIGIRGTAQALIIAAVLAGWALLDGRRRHLTRNLVLFLPQQWLGIMSAWAALRAIRQGAYADGTVVSAIHIAADQIFVVVFAALHVLGLVVWSMTREPSSYREA